MNYQSENFGGECDFRSNLHDGWLVDFHLHEYSELLFCKDGEGLVTVGGEAMPLSADQMVWIPPNYVHNYDFKDATVICAVFSNDLIPLFFKALDGRHFCVRAIDAKEFASILERLPSLKKEDYLTVSGYLNLLCAHVIKHSTFDTERPSDGSLYQKVISYIATHYTESLTLTSVAREFGYNEKYLSHTLHALTGIHFTKLVNFYRLNHAKNLLMSKTDESITTVAQRSGFFSINTFNRAFIEGTGLTPSEYRRRFGK